MAFDAFFLVVKEPFSRSLALSGLSNATVAGDHKCLTQAMREIKLPKYETCANHCEYVSLNNERGGDFFCPGI